MFVSSQLASIILAMSMLLCLSQAGQHGKEDHGVQELRTTRKSLDIAVLVCMGI